MDRFMPKWQSHCEALNGLATRIGSIVWKCISVGDKTRPLIELLKNCEDPTTIVILGKLA